MFICQIQITKIVLWSCSKNFNIVWVLGVIVSQ